MRLIFKRILFLLIIVNIDGKMQHMNNVFCDADEQKITIIIEIVKHNLNNNGWNNILFIGNLSDTLYNELKEMPLTFAVASIDEDEKDSENVVPYHSNVIIINCYNFEDFENAIRKSATLPYWHALSNIILYYHAPYEKEVVSKIFFIFWYYRVTNVIIIQYDDNEKVLLISHYNPYISDEYKLAYLYGCWIRRKIGMPIEGFAESFICVKQCHNVTLHSKLRPNNLGTCIGFDTDLILYGDSKTALNLSLFVDVGRDLHGFTLRAFTIEVLPFLGIEEHSNGSYTLYRRDGMIWNTMAELLNFKIDLTPAKDIMKQKFDFEVNIQQVFTFTQRKGDLILFPLYQFDLIIAQIDYTFPFMDSGVCFLSRRADFETIVFNAKLLQMNLDVIIQLLLCFLCTWLLFFLFNLEELRKFSYDQIGKDLLNTFRTVLSISIYNPPRRGSFRIFLTISVWSFFVINFNTQAAIISLFSAHKRGKEVDTFEDIIEKGYNIEGMASPDVILPETEEKYRIITSRMEAVPDLFTCVNSMVNDSRRFCIIDCAVGRYLVRNMLDDKGEQFLHIASDARIHSHYLNMILHKHSPLTRHFNRYIIRLFEAGIIKKWMDYRFKNIKEDVPIKPLGMEDMEGIFKCYCFLLGISIIIFVFEVLLGYIKRAMQNWRKYMLRPHINLNFNKRFGLHKIRSNIKKNRSNVDISTQTI